MCFVVHPDYSEPLFADKDILCFKKGTLDWVDIYSPRQVFVSLFRGHIYRFQELQPKIRLDSEGGIILEGYHSYTPEHTIVSLPTRCFVSITLVKCIIPRGSTYYYNPDTHEYVSSSLMVLETAY